MQNYQHFKSIVQATNCIIVFFMNKLTNYLLLPLLVAVLAIGLVTLPFILLFALLNDDDQYYRNKRLETYFRGVGDKNFFCYNNRSDAKDYIETHLLPHLDYEIELIYLDGKTPKSAYQQEIIAQVLYDFKDYTRFPHLVKVRDGKLIDKSINNAFFNTMRQNKPMEQLIAEINYFFELETETNTGA